MTSCRCQHEEHRDDFAHLAQNRKLCFRLYRTSATHWQTAAANHSSLRRCATTRAPESTYRAAIHARCWREWAEHRPARWPTAARGAESAADATLLPACG